MANAWRSQASMLRTCYVAEVLKHNVMSKSQNKGYYAVQGHSRSPMSVPTESPNATSH